MNTLGSRLFGNGWGFSADPLSLFFAVMATLAGLATLVYSLRAVKGEERKAEFYAYLGLQWAGLVGVFFSGHLLLTFLFWMVSLVSAWGLIGLRGTGPQLRTANLFLVVTTAGALLMLSGFYLAFAQAGTFGLEGLTGTRLSHLSFLLILAGILTAAAAFPFHTWLLNAATVPAPVGALLNSAAPLAGLYLFIRLFYGTLIPPENTAYLPVLLLFGSLATGFAALCENRLKALLTLATISQLSLVYFGLSLFATIGVAGALTFLLAHTLGKTGLFLTSGILEEWTGGDDIGKMGGYFKSQPLLTGLFLVSAFSTISIPPFLGFWGMDLLLEAPFAAGRFVMGSFGIVAGGLGLVYLLRAFYQVFLGQAKTARTERAPATLSWAPIGALTLLSFFLGLWPNLILRIFR